MSAATYDLHIDKGSTYRASIEWLDPAGVPIDITGYRILFQIRHYAQAASPLLSFDSAALTAGQTLGPLNATGIVAFTLSDEVTAAAALVEGIHVWDILVESASGVRDKLARGLAYVNPAITRVT